ncbi:Protein NEDD1 [Nymphon striatum]|nr:Protein NEDD1 [Nymphon striatum]
MMVADDSRNSKSEILEWLIEADFFNIDICIYYAVMQARYGAHNEIEKMSMCRHLATCGEDVKFWDFPNLILASLPFGDNKVVLTYIKNGTFSTVDLIVDTKVTYVKFLKRASRYLSFGCSDGKVLIWDLKSRKLKQSYSCPTQATSVMCLEPNWNDSFFAAGYGNGDIILYNSIMGQSLPALKTNDKQAIRSICFNTVKRSMLGSSCDSGTVALWDSNTKQLVHQFSSHFAPSTGLAFSPVNDLLLASVGLDKKIVCYDIQRKLPIQTLDVESPLTCIDFLNNGSMLAVGTSRGKVLLYDLRYPSKPSKTIIAHKTSVSCVSFQNIPESRPKNKDVKVKERNVQKPEYNIAKNASSSDQVDHHPVDNSPIVTSESRNSLTNKIFSPICEGELLSPAETPSSSNCRNSVGDGHTTSTESEKKIPSSQVRRQPIGSGWQTPPLIGDRPITAGFAENDSKINSIPDRVRRRSNSLENHNSEIRNYNETINQTPIPESVHVIQETIRSSNSSLNVFSPIDFPHSSSIDHHEAASQSISSSFCAQNSPTTSVSESRNIDGGEQNSDNHVKFVTASPVKSTNAETVQHCTNCRENNQESQESQLNSLKIDAIQKQIQELRDELEDFHDMTHRDYLNLHVAVVKEFQIQMLRWAQPTHYQTVDSAALPVHLSEDDVVSAPKSLQPSVGSLEIFEFQLGSNFTGLFLKERSTDREHLGCCVLEPLVEDGVELIVVGLPELPLAIKRHVAFEFFHTFSLALDDVRNLSPTASMSLDAAFYANELQNSLRYFSINEDLLKQVEELQEENKHLRAMY